MKHTAYLRLKCYVYHLQYYPLNQLYDFFGGGEIYSI